MASSASTYAVERPEPGGVLLAAGVGSAVGGVVMVLVTGAPYEAGKAEQDWPDWYRESDWASTRAVNTVGWSVLVAGAGVAAAGGLVLALAPSQSGPVSVVPTPSGVLILGVFP